MGKPPALPGDPQRLTSPGVCESFPFRESFTDCMRDSHFVIPATSLGGNPAALMFQAANQQNKDTGFPPRDAAGMTSVWPQPQRVAEK